MNVFGDGQTSDVYEYNAGIPQGSLFGPTLRLLYISGLTKNILRSLVILYIYKEEGLTWNI